MNNKSLNRVANKTGVTNNTTKFHNASMVDLEQILSLSTTPLTAYTIIAALCCLILTHFLQTDNSPNRDLMERNDIRHNMNSKIPPGCILLIRAINVIALIYYGCQITSVVSFIYTYSNFKAAVGVECLLLHPLRELTDGLINYCLAMCGLFLYVRRYKKMSRIILNTKSFALLCLVLVATILIITVELPFILRNYLKIEKSSNVLNVTNASSNSTYVCYYGFGNNWHFYHLMGVVMYQILPFVLTMGFLLELLHRNMVSSRKIHRIDSVFASRNTINGPIPVTEDSEEEPSVLSLPQSSNFHVRSDNRDKDCLHDSNLALTRDNFQQDIQQNDNTREILDDTKRKGARKSNYIHKMFIVLIIQFFIYSLTSIPLSLYFIPFDSRFQYLYVAYEFLQSLNRMLAPTIIIIFLSLALHNRYYKSH